ncbi:MAG: hypothetical protein J7619_23190 [Dyadobacter sp.]|uniref:hypothetical protein n=1 Tax=Dyadobacter sp. TaxID=1914288 RepID=UPI001AFEE752|nr:hypothetical protein [Dyadobacter sp.]MBO9615621.1 hypothetical protein [Dyadobacter sp.]
MKFYEKLDVVSSVLATAWLTIKGIFTNPTLLLLSSSTVGVVQVFTYRKDLTVKLVAAVGICFILMTFLGMVKHYKVGEWKAEIFLKKTVEQFVVMVAVVLLGYVASLVVGVVFSVVTQAVPEATPIPSVSLYFIFAGYSVMIAYYFVKCCDLVEQIIPNLVPKWFAAPFRKFRETGDMKDMLSFQSEEGKEVVK